MIPSRAGNLRYASIEAVGREGKTKGAPNEIKLEKIFTRSDKKLY
jgi:hypothetical protein